MGGALTFERDGTRYTLYVLMETEDSEAMHFWPASQEDIDHALIAGLAGDATHQDGADGTVPSEHDYVAKGAAHE